MCHEIDTELVLAWSEGRGKHLRCADNTACLFRLLRNSNAGNVVVLRTRRYGPDELEAA